MAFSLFFRLAEFERSDRADRLGILNKANEVQTENLKELCANLMDPIRVRAQRPVTILSGLRVDQLNAATPGSSKTSQHRTGEACDFRIKGVSPAATALWLVESCGDLIWDQLILEYAVQGDQNRGWNHISFSRLGKNRRQVLHASTSFSGYRAGLPDWVADEPRADIRRIP